MKRASAQPRRPAWLPSSYVGGPFAPRSADVSANGRIAKPPRKRRPVLFVSPMVSEAEGRLTIRIPIALRPEKNLREHWSKRHRRVAGQRAAVRLYRRQLARVRLPCVVEIVRIAPCDLDDDNRIRSASAVRDEIADLLGVNDKDPRVAFIVKPRRDRPYTFGAEITIRWTAAP